MGQIQTILFSGTCAALSEQTLVPPMIRFPFKIRRLRIKFALNTNATLRIKFFISPDPSDPSTGEPTGTNIFSARGQVDYIVGDDEWIDMEHEINNPTINTWLKMYGNNLDVFAHSMSAQVTIESMEEE